MQYEVIVVGGGTSGCAAAYNLAKSNIKTLLIEKEIHLGGAMTSMLVTPAMQSINSSLNTEFFEDLVLELQELNAQITYSDGNKGWFNPELLKIALDRLLLKVGVDIYYNTSIKSVSIENNRIEGIEIISNMLSEYIGAIYVVDATGNAEVAKLCQCQFLNNIEEQQPTTLRFLMSGVDVEAFGKWLLDFDQDRNVTTVAKIGNQTHLSTAYTWDKSAKWALSPLFNDAVASGVLKDTDRNYFQLFTIPNMPTSIAFNAPRIHFNPEINVLDNKQSSKALIEGREAIFRLSIFCKNYLSGFENAYISNIATALGVRVSRRVKGKYIYTVDDLRSGKKFRNPVLISNYPIDVHSSKADKSILEHQTVEYQLPLESLMSYDVSNLFMVGRCISCDFLAQAALRIQPSCFSMGEGIAKYIKTQLR